MNARLFVDTNVWVYLFCSDKTKGAVAKKLIDEHFGSIVISTQIIGELYHTLVRKGFKSKKEAKEIAEYLIATFSTAEVDLYKTLLALEISDKYQFSYWDSLVAATAIAEECGVLLTEDMQDGQKIEGKLTVKNPF